MDVDLLVSGATLILATGETVPNGVLAVKDGRFVHVGPAADFAARERIDARGQVACAGLINTHTHLYQCLLKGLGADLPLREWIDALIFPVLPHLTEQDCEIAALLGCLEAAHSGTTTVLDYAVGRPNPALYDATLDAAARVGVRLHLGRGVSEVAMGDVPPERAIAYALADVERLRATYGSRIWIASAPLWLMSNASMRQTLDWARASEIPMTLHVNETDVDDDEAMRRFGVRNVPYLAGMGILGPDLLAAHCVRVDERDLELLAGFDVAVAFNPVSNLYLGNGVPPVPRMRRLGMRVGLGTDGAASNNSQDMFDVLKLAALTLKGAARDPRAITAAECLEMATLGGARAMGIEGETGSLAVGKSADFFLFDPLATATSVPMHDPIATLVYSASSAGVRTTVVAGRVILRDGQVVTVDERQVLRTAADRAAALVERAGLAPRPVAWQ